ncbi:MAG: reverse transcriptase family protein, partial [Candidatus Thiodiazotropha sp.]
GDYEAIRRELGEVRWEEMDNLNVEDSYAFFTEKIDHAVSNNVPLVKSSGKGKKKKWVNRDCISSIKKKHKAWNSYIHTKSRRDFDKYCAARNKCTSVTRAAKRKFEKTIVNNMNKDSKGFWAYVKQQTKSRSGICDLKNENQEVLTDSEGKANVLNNFFSSVFVVEPPTSIPVFDIRYAGVPVTNMLIERESVLKQLSSLNVNKSMGPDNCHPKVLKEAADILSYPLQKIMNKTFEEQRIPGIWKKASVTALYKNKGDKSDPSNYRPVSLTCVPCKLCEKSVREVLMNHMTINNLFSESQFGFRNKRNCVLQLLDVLDDWSAAYDDSIQVDTIYLDIKKAFDTVPHRRLLCKLKAYGIDGEILSWIKDFLSNRMQRVRVNSFYSDWKDVSSGIPQGSVLGPVLFIIYINDLPECVESVCKIFADDTKIYRLITSRADQDALQQDLLNLCKWSQDWLLKFSIPKCKTIQFGNVKCNYTYQMEDSTNSLIDLPIEDEEKDLGVIFENSLKFNKQVMDVVNRTKRLTGMIKRTFRYMNKSLFLTVYKSLIRSIVDYAITIWYPTTKKNIQLVENIQRRATRIVPELRGLSYTQRIKALNLPTLLYRRQRYDLIQIYKIVHHIDDIEPTKLFSFNDNITRGHIFRIYKPSVKKTLRKNVFPVRCIDAWNELPEEIVTSQSTLSFKSSLDKLWRDKRYDVSQIY